MLWHFIRAIITLTRTEICTRIVGYVCDRSDHVIFDRIVEEHWTRKGFECSKLSELFCGGLEDTSPWINEGLGRSRGNLESSFKNLLGLLHILS